MSGPGCFQDIEPGGAVVALNTQTRPPLTDRARASSDNGINGEPSCPPPALSAATRRGRSASLLPAPMGGCASTSIHLPPPDGSYIPPTGTGMSLRRRETYKIAPPPSPSPMVDQVGLGGGGG